MPPPGINTREQGDCSTRCQRGRSCVRLSPIWGGKLFTLSALKIVGFSKVPSRFIYEISTNGVI